MDTGENNQDQHTFWCRGLWEAVCIIIIIIFFFSPFIQDKFTEGSMLEINPLHRVKQLMSNRVPFGIYTQKGSRIPTNKES